MSIKYWLWKRNLMVKKIHLNMWLDTMSLLSHNASCIMLPQMIGIAKYFDSNKTIFLGLVMNNW